jgi:hypothetical protein
VALIYGCVVLLDRRMPNVVPSTENSRFSEERARAFLERITAIGPRSSGSIALEVTHLNVNQMLLLQIDTVKLMTDKILQLKEGFERTNVNRLEFDIQRPTGCYNLKFLTPFTLCYNEITNIVVRVGPKTPSRHAILLNCHLDTLPDTPGATDDAVSCAIYIEMLEVLSKRKTQMENDIVFLFNGGISLKC